MTDLNFRNLPAREFTTAEAKNWLGLPAEHPNEEIERALQQRGYMQTSRRLPYTLTFEEVWVHRAGTGV